MKEKSPIKYFIQKEFGIEISPLLQKYLLNPTLVNTANKETLKKIIEEFKPVYQKYRYILDGNSYIVNILALYLRCRIPNCFDE